MQNPTFFDNNFKLFAWLLSIFITVFYFSNTLVWWLYGFKQWQISIEVPNQLNKNANGLRISSSCFEIIKWIGIAINAALCLALGVFRYLTVIKLADKSKNDFPVLHTEFRLTASSACLAVLASFFLIDALRRMNKSFKENHTFSSNKFAMFLHILAIFISQAGLVVLIFFLQIEVTAGKTDEKARNIADTLKMVLSITLCTAQLIFVFLLVRIQKPFELQTDEKREGTETSNK